MAIFYEMSINHKVVMSFPSNPNQVKGFIRLKWPTL